MRRKRKDIALAAAAGQIDRGRLSNAGPVPALDVFWSAAFANAESGSRRSAAEPRFRSHYCKVVRALACYKCLVFQKMRYNVLCANALATRFFSQLRARRAVRFSSARGLAPRARLRFAPPRARRALARGAARLSAGRGARIRKRIYLPQKKKEVNMANYRSPVFSEMAGGLGGAALQKGGSGNIIRAKRRPSNPQTGGQIKVRALASYLSRQWASGLTEEQRLKWNEAAKEIRTSNRLGESSRISGINLFTQVNATSRMAGGAALIAEPPAKSNVVIPLITSATLDTTELSVTLSGALPTGFSLLIQASKMLSAGRASGAVKYCALKSAPTSGTLYNFTNEYTALYGAPVSGRKIIIRAFIVKPSTGESYPIGGHTGIID